MNDNSLLTLPTKCQIAELMMILFTCLNIVSKHKHTRSVKECKVHEGYQKPCKVCIKCHFVLCDILNNSFYHTYALRILIGHYTSHLTWAAARNSWLHRCETWRPSVFNPLTPGGGGGWFQPPVRFFFCCNSETAWVIVFIFAIPVH